MPLTQGQKQQLQQRHDEFVEVRPYLRTGVALLLRMFADNGTPETSYQEADKFLNELEMDLVNPTSGARHIGPID